MRIDSRVFGLCLIFLACLEASAQRFVKVFDNIDALVAANPNDVHTNAFVAGLTNISIYTWSSASTEPTNANLAVLKANNFDTGRWFIHPVGGGAGVTNFFTYAYFTNITVIESFQFIGTNFAITNFYFNSTYITNINQGVGDSLWTNSTTDSGAIQPEPDANVFVPGEVHVGQSGEAGVIELFSTNGTYSSSLTVNPYGTLIVDGAGLTNLFSLTSQDTTVFNVAAQSGYAGGGTKALFDDGTYKAVTYPPGSTATNININPTDGYIPYRSNATVFGDSPLFRRASNAVANEGYTLLGTTNQLPTFATYQQTLGVFGTPGTPAFNLDVVQSGTTYPVFWFYTQTNGPTHEAFYLQSIDAGTLGGNSRLVYAENLTRTTNSTAQVDSPLASAFGTIGIYGLASPNNYPNLMTMGVFGRSDGTGGTNAWNVGVGATVDTPLPASTNAALHARVKGESGVHAGALVETRLASGDNGAVNLAASAVLVLDSGLTGDTLIDGRSGNGTTNQFKVAYPSGYTGAGTLFLSDDGTYQAITSPPGATVTNININPTDGYYPYRSNSTTFGDGGWFHRSSSEAALGATNKYLRVSGNEMDFVNGAATTALLGLNNSSGHILRMTVTTTQGALTTDRATMNIGQNAGTGNILLDTTKFWPAPPLSLGYSGSPGYWNTAWLASNVYFLGTGMGTANYERMAITHWGTNTGITFDSQALGTGTYRPFHLTVGGGSPLITFDTNGVILFGGVTNALYRSGSDLVYTNGRTSTGPIFKVIDGSGSAAEFGSKSGIATVEGPSGVDLVKNVSDVVRWDGNTWFDPAGNGAKDFGNGSHQWRDLYLARRVVWNGTTNSVWDLAGSFADPNSNVPACSPGSTYRSFAGGAGATFWVKESGVNTQTGWVAK